MTRGTPAKKTAPAGEPGDVTSPSAEVADAPGAPRVDRAVLTGGDPDDRAGVAAPTAAQAADDEIGAEVPAGIEGTGLPGDEGIRDPQAGARPAGDDGTTRPAVEHRAASRAAAGAPTAAPPAAPLTAPGIHVPQGRPAHDSASGAAASAAARVSPTEQRLIVRDGESGEYVDVDPDLIFVFAPPPAQYATSTVRLYEQHRVPNTRTDTRTLVFPAGAMVEAGRARALVAAAKTRQARQGVAVGEQ